MNVKVKGNGNCRCYGNIMVEAVVSLVCLTLILPWKEMRCNI
jgi:hypothetical protein